jgi:hypothetical protein
MQDNLICRYIDAHTGAVVDEIPFLDSSLGWYRRADGQWEIAGRYLADYTRPTLEWLAANPEPR